MRTFKRFERGFYIINIINYNILKTIYRLYFDCGRQGALEGVFVDTTERVNALIDSEIEVYFGEVLGKHSEIYGPIEVEDISEVSSDPTTVQMFIDNDLSSGLNPFDYQALDVSIEGYDTDDLNVGEIIDIWIKENSDEWQKIMDSPNTEG